ncbi:M48 family metallopeptidase [Alkalihalobacillus macyae]|uniref:M48 family metallopeptidase n=1 Tax=Guptibacillus hwajinpoensis TaxID=208199 RepID=UPI00273C491B|nr:M48 family metallopeptidase [Alkalihalobacillus macyae]MDP4550677.1 M48 family metallopeptidase [Alkalihalobacillus macyae]
MNDSKKLISTSEKTLFIILLIFSIATYLLLFLSILGVGIAIALWIASFFAHGIRMGQIRSNGVKISPSQYPQIFERLQDLSTRMEIGKVPDLYVVESGGMLNAFATRLLGRNTVVLYSDIFELIQEEAEEEITFILAHELAHIKRNHILKQMMLLPGNLIPFIGTAYSRACEYTCDRMATNMINSGERASHALIILAVGKRLYQSVNKDAYIKQLQAEKSFFVWLSELLSTHPPLPKRIAEVEHFMDIRQKEHFQLPRRKLAILSVVLLVVMGGSTGVVVLTTQYIGPVISQVFSDELLYDVENVTPLMESIVEDDYQTFQDRLTEEDLTATDADGWNALHYAARYSEDERILQELLNYGMALDDRDDFGASALMFAVEEGSIMKVDLLLEAGADPNLRDIDGWPPLFYSIYSEAPDNLLISERLLEQGADSSAQDDQGMTALDLAEEMEDTAHLALLSGGSSLNK